VHVSDSITHNTALIGVTGSGKSYLAFHLIEAYIEAGIKVLVLDLTRQHWQFLQHKNPTALTSADGVVNWLAGDSKLAIHQFANANFGFPRATADFIEKAFGWLQEHTTLQAGRDAPAQLCIVLEEAHSLIPEWNQVAQEGDKNQVNRAARMILQGRKFGLGTLLITQRTANVTKTILNQCNTIFALRSFDQTGLDFLRNYMGEEYSQAISTLPQYTAILVGKASSSARPIILRVTDFKNRWQGAPRGQTTTGVTTPPE
jgi:DNA helicase HerA-like ATPase